VRRVVVGVLDELGVEHPLARESRRRLASALY
jgi:putative thioredoxin